jgi:transcriptional regulator with XRE-family HTH domain
MRDMRLHAYDTPDCLIVTIESDTPYACALNKHAPRISARTPAMKADAVSRPFLRWVGRACRQAREEHGVHQVQIAAAMRVNQATIARFEDGSAWPRRPEEVLMAYANELGMDVRVLWLHGFVLWIEAEPVLDEQSQAEIRAAIGRLAPSEEAG